MKEIYKIYASTFFVGLALSVSVISTLFYLANGLTQAQVATIFSAFMISLALFEIPTGGIADTFGHKTSVFLGIATHALSCLVTALSSNFYMFLFSMLLAGLGFALVSGAYSSLIHDILNKLGKSEDFTRINGKTNAIFLIGPIITSPLMSLLYKNDIRLPYLVAFVLLAIAAFIMLLVKWEFRDDKPTFNVYFKKMKNGIKNVLKNKRIIGLIIISIGLGFSRSLFNQNINQPFQLSIGIEIALLGTIAAIIAGFEAVTSAFSHRLLKKTGTYFSLLFIIIVSTVSLILLSKINTLLGLLPIFIFFITHTYRETVIMTLYQKESNENERATMISTTSFLIYIVVGLMLPIGGFSIDFLGIQQTMIAIGIFSVVLGLMGTLIYKKQFN